MKSKYRKELFKPSCIQLYCVLGLAVQNLQTLKFRLTEKQYYTTKVLNSTVHGKNQHNLDINRIISNGKHDSMLYKMGTFTLQEMHSNRRKQLFEKR